MNAVTTVLAEFFKLCEALAKRWGVSRSRLSEALAAMLAKQRGRDLTKRFDAVYQTEDSRLDEVVHELQVRSLRLTGEADDQDDPPT